MNRGRNGGLLDSLKSLPLTAQAGRFARADAIDPVGVEGLDGIGIEFKVHERGYFQSVWNPILSLGGRGGG